WPLPRHACDLQRNICAARRRHNGSVHWPCRLPAADEPPGARTIPKSTRTYREAIRWLPEPEPLPCYTPTCYNPAPPFATIHVDRRGGWLDRSRHTPWFG